MGFADKIINLEKLYMKGFRPAYLVRTALLNRFPKIKLLL